MTGTIDKAIETVLKVEQWKSFEKDNLVAIWGVDKRYWPTEFDKMVAMSEADSRSYAKQFYLVQFWERFDCDNLPYPLNVYHFDTAVNRERSASDNIKKTKDPNKYLLLRILDYCTLADKNPDKRIYFRGWINRTIGLWLKFPVTDEPVNVPEVKKDEVVKESSPKPLGEMSIFEKIKWALKAKKTFEEGTMTNPGIKTTELWVAIVMAIVTFLNAYLGWGLSTEQVLTTMAPLIAYIVGRSAVKMTERKNPD
jgi:hypothetical protein